MSASRFPILGTRESVPWAAVAPHEQQAGENHGQTLKGLAGRGGLSWCELAAVLEDRPWHRMPDNEAGRRCRELVALFEIAPPETV
jgi:hypothetical protein